MLSEFANFGHHLAATAYAAAATDGVEIDTKFTGGIEDVRAALDLALSPRWGKDDANRVGHDEAPTTACGRRNGGALHRRRHLRQDRAWRQSMQHSLRRDR